MVFKNVSNLAAYLRAFFPNEANQTVTSNRAKFEDLKSLFKWQISNMNAGAQPHPTWDTKNVMPNLNDDNLKKLNRCIQPRGFMRRYQII